MKSILVNDPSICAWGYVVMSTTGEILEVGCIKTESESKKRRIRKGDDTVRRISEINGKLLHLIHQYNVIHILTEQPHGSQSASAAVMIGNVVGMIQTISDCLSIGVDYFSEGDSKNNLLSKRSATKNEVKSAISKIYDVPWTGIGYRDEAIADAMAIWHLARRSSPSVRMLWNSDKK